MNNNPINRQERHAIAKRIGWTCHQVRAAVKKLGAGEFRMRAADGTLPAPGPRQKPKRGGASNWEMRRLEAFRDMLRDMD
jgi:hypothetical protein